MRRKRTGTPVPLPRRDEFDGDDLSWFDAVQTALLTRGEHSLALDLFPLLPAEMEERLTNHFKENAA